MHLSLHNLWRGERGEEKKKRKGRKQCIITNTPYNFENFICSGLASRKWNRADAKANKSTE
jgi:hypothetical protein